VALRWDPEAGSDRSVRWGELLANVGRLRDRLQAAPDGGWVLLTEDAYAFAVGLLALWHSGRYAISPPNRQLGSLRVLQTRAAGVLTDRPEWFLEGSSVDPLLREGHSEISSGTGFSPINESTSFGPLDPDSLAVEFYTSGTTGDEKPVLKKIRHLEDEVNELGGHWDALLKDAVVFSSASHQHLYGLLFGVLWPLSSGHVFAAQHFLHAGELIPRLRATDRSVLASVPTHLKRLAGHAQSPLLRDRCRAIFSSGGPLPQETAHRIAGFLGVAPIEILGSTETGGIAWRCQAPEEPEPLWRPFGSVRIGRDAALGTLQVRSPFVSVGSPDGFSTGDRIALHDEGRFELLGRADRVVKIGERRLDLTRMESQLRGQEWVEDVALTTLQREIEEPDTERADPTERVAAVVVPSRQGWALIRDSGRRAFSSGLRSSLADAWDPVLHPRYWRFVVELPENQQGKIAQSLLRALFQDPDWGQLAGDRPERLGEIRSPQSIERSCLVPSDLSCFPGHFPDRPVVPGVLQLDWALALAEVWMGQALRVTEIESLKLLLPLEPGMRFRMRVTRPQSTRLEIKLWNEDEVFAKARIRIAEMRE
jgi:acyl-coenzyme A synthetase/AMP-(fatty) acid ligase/3-hydroxymyristoyl/3-hydroxydecanoyl-(acyl carrier protein) dehydratase